MANDRKLLVPAGLVVAAANPSGASKGDLYYNSTADEVRVYNGSSWVAIGSGGGGSTSEPSVSDFFLR